MSENRIDELEHIAELWDAVRDLEENARRLVSRIDELEAKQSSMGEVMRRRFDLVNFRVGWTKRGC